MNLFKKIFSTAPEEEPTKTNIKTSVLEMSSLDETFVQNFIDKGGKFLYCTNQEEVNQNLSNIIKENNWEKVVCFNNDLNKILTIVDSDSTSTISKQYPFFTYCEHLLADEGSILFSSEQVHYHKIAELPDYFIVFAKTSQMVKDKSEGLMGIRQTYQKNFPTNISSIKSYVPEKVDDDFLSFGNNNAKNLYLLLLEDL
ncbi:hypothetical protein UMM65_16915 [Aureibaculum sp. 2210JD6-5]|uniref:hypothetical protein n=1 Tax=Aureibaculum sp. 2210JD6-5 TaxID=3103957 RepID=UPI002AAD8224|nr:hypothetical protein [Aureibaculum sp. 2210JD6-5]MDY7396930.1 hypothetical protein [Aureibaculum sp. 2210JD6-5]